jgi:branched-subunit amino acid aminotransferase/4-amino-4-deoxychorismate lyase
LVSDSGPERYWFEGRIVAADDRAALDRVRALLARAGCYTTARVTGGLATWPEYHCRRLRRDAEALGIGRPRDEAVLRCFLELGRSQFGDRTGVIRLQACPDEREGLQLVGVPRPLGIERPHWDAVIAPIPHMGPEPRGGAKVSYRAVYEEARRFSDAAGVDEALLFDAHGQMVEGARSNLLMLTASGELVTPDLKLGAVAGIGAQITRERVPEIVPGIIDRAALERARELIAINAVRGPCPVVEVDGRPVGNGSPGPWAERLQGLLASD